MNANQRSNLGPLLQKGVEFRSGTDESPGNYYVTGIDCGKVWMISGPYDHHQDAIDSVDAAKEICCRENSWCHFWSFGTSKLGENGPGLLERKMPGWKETA